MKDMPTLQPEGLVLDTYLPREDVRDAFVSKDYSSKGCKPPKGVDYGPCTLPMFAQHSWWARDWNSMTNDQIFDCCVAPQSDTRTYDCPPTYWGGSPFCLPVMLKNCTPTTWDITDNCDKYMAYFSGADTSAQEQVLTSALSGWVSGLNGGKPSSADPFVKTATKYCSQFPGLCDTYLQDACKNVTKDDLLNNPDLSKLCGCFMQDKEYMLPGIIPVECNGACAINNHPDINGVTRGQLNKISGIREPLVCDQSTCVIDDVSISMIDTQVDGKVQFNQLCGNCPDGDCTCVLNNISIYAANSVLGGDIDFSQSCSSCSQGAGKVQNPIGCNGGLPPSPVPPSISTSTTVENVVENLSRAYSSNKSFWIWGIVAVLMVIIGLIAFAYIQKRKGH